MLNSYPSMTAHRKRHLPADTDCPVPHTKRLALDLAALSLTPLSAPPVTMEWNEPTDRADSMAIDYEPKWNKHSVVIHDLEQELKEIEAAEEELIAKQDVLVLNEAVAQELKRQRAPLEPPKATVPPSRYVNEYSIRDDNAVDYSMALILWKPNTIAQYPQSVANSKESKKEEDEEIEECMEMEYE